MATEKPISVGDLVQVVRDPPCGCKSPATGKIFTVVWIEAIPTKSLCTRCGFEWGPDAQADDGAFLWASVSRLKRIPPLDELETVRTEDEVTA